MALVETPQPLSVDSFSCSWLIDMKLALESLSDSFREALDSSDESSFIEMDPNMPPSKRFKKLGKDFDFELPCLEQSPATIVHADELFSNGLLMPLVSTPKTGSSADSSPCASPFSDDQNRRASSAADVRKFRCSSLRRCRSLLSRKTIEKYLHFVYLLLEKIRRCKSKQKRNRGADKRIGALKNSSRSFSPQASPRMSVGSSGSDWRISLDSEGSIHEAVLHCKRSFNM